jgi:hypothetical protein
VKDAANQVAVVFFPLTSTTARDIWCLGNQNSLSLLKTCHGNKHCILVAASSPRNGWHCLCYVRKFVLLFMQNILREGCWRRTCPCANLPWVMVQGLKFNNWSFWLCFFVTHLIYLVRTNPALQHWIINVNTVCNKSRGRGVCGKIRQFCWLSWNLNPSPPHTLTHTHNTHSHNQTHTWFFHSNSDQFTRLQSKYACRVFIGCTH